MLTVRLADGSTVYGFGAFSVLARNADGVPDPYWQKLAEQSIAESGDLYTALTSLPGAKVLHEGTSRAGVPAPSDREPVRALPDTRASRAKGRKKR